MNKKINLSDLYPGLSYNIRELRKELGLTQKELAEIAKISYRTIQNYENGITPPSLNIIEKIALALGVSVERLISNYIFDNNTTATEILEKININKYLNENEIRDLSYININLFTDTLILIPPDIRIINILLKLLEKLTIEYSLVVKIIQIEKIDYISKIFLEELKRRKFITIKEWAKKISLLFFIYLKIITKMIYNI